MLPTQHTHIHKHQSSSYTPPPNAGRHCLLSIIGTALVYSLSPKGLQKPLAGVFGTVTLGLSLGASPSCIGRVITSIFNSRHDDDDYERKGLGRGFVPSSRLSSSPQPMSTTSLHPSPSPGGQPQLQPKRKKAGEGNFPPTSYSNADTDLNGSSSFVYIPLEGSQPHQQPTRKTK